MTTITRRAALAGAAATAIPTAALAAASPQAASSPHPDAQLIELGRQLDAAWAVERAVDARKGVSDEEVEAALSATGAVVDQIAEADAHTLDGLRVKARAFLWCSYPAEPTTEIRLAGQISDYLLAMGGSHG